MIPYGLLPSLSTAYLLFVNIAMPAEDLPFELLGVLVPELCSFAIQW
jgi:hypothetical protein